MGLLVPGFITLFVRSQFVTGRRRSRSEDLLSYFTVSLIYYALSFPFVGVTLSLRTIGPPAATAAFSSLPARCRP